MSQEDIKNLIAEACDYETRDADHEQSIPSGFPVGFRMTEQGIEYLRSQDDWRWLCSRLVVTAHTYDENDCNHGRILEFTNSNGSTKEYVMPMEFLSGNGEELRKELLSRGVIMASENEARHRLNAYISSSNPVARALCVDKVGWFGNHYVRPEKVYGTSANERIVFQAKGSVILSKTTLKGNLEGWQEHIGQYIVDNPILLIAVCAALTAPLLHVLNEENFAIHFSGSSSIGKTTAIRVASSVYGNPIHSWRTTDNAAESLACQANDGLLIFDELGEVDAKSVDNMAYMLGNGSGKARANKNGDARPIKTFKLIILSTGEVGLDGKLGEIGKQQKAGQSVRFIELSADAGHDHGIYKNVHGFENGEYLSRHFKDMIEQHTGTLGDAWLTCLTQGEDSQETILEQIKAYQEAWIDRYVPKNANGQVKRCGRKFALLAAVGELAIKRCLLTGQPIEQKIDTPPVLGALSESLNTLYQSWIQQRGGADSHELTEAINCLRQFINENGSSRFENPWSDKSHDRTHDDKSPSHINPTHRTHHRAGYRKLIDGQWHYYIFPKVFEAEILKGKDKNNVLKALADKGIIERDANGKATKSISIPGDKQQRLIAISPDSLSQEDDHDV